MNCSVPTIAPEATLIGSGAIDRLPELVNATGAKRALLVCGRTSLEKSGAARILPALGFSVALRRWDQHRPNPTAEHLAAGLAVATAHRPDVILGIGGGSTLDMAKLIAALASREDGSDIGRLSRMIESHEVAGPREAGLILAPTTSGSGAQATHFATVYVETVKHSVSGEALLPDRVILDPNLTMSGTEYQRAVSGIDALAQAIESLWALDGDDRSRKDAEAAIGLLLPALVDFARHPNLSTADAMAKGSHLAGVAINRSRTTLPHALSYALTQCVGLPHGHAVAHTLPAIISRHLTADSDAIVGARVADHRRNMDRLREALNVADDDAAVSRVEGLIRDLGLRDPQRSAHAAIVAQVGELARSMDPVRSRNNPVRLDLEDLRAVLLEGIVTA